MINFSKTAILGAVLAVSAPFASAAGIPFTGTLDTYGAPASGSFTATGTPSGGTVTGTFSLNSVGAVQISTIGTPNLSTFAGESGANVSLKPFNSTSITTILPGTLITTVTNTLVAGPALGTTLSFYALTESTPIETVLNGNVDFNVYGYFSDAAGGFSDTLGVVDISYNALNGSLTENGMVLPPAVPEPSSLMLLGTGLVSAAGMMIRRRRVA